MLIRTLLIWLIALALPAQGVSAATMAFCGQAQAHHRAEATAHDHHPAAAAHHHDAGGHTLAVADNDAATPAVASHDGHGCSACASCCSAGALPSTLPTVPTPEVGPTVFAAVDGSGGSRVADGLERPPRRACA